MQLGKSGRLQGSFYKEVNFFSEQEHNLVQVMCLYLVRGSSVGGGCSWGCIEMALDKSVAVCLH